MFHHELHVVGVHEGAMLDGIDAADHRAADGLGAVSVCGHDEAVVMRGGHHRANFFQGELRVVAARALIHDTARGHDLDHVVAELVVLAHRFGRILRTVDDAVGGS